MADRSGYLIPRRFWDWAADPWFARGAVWVVTLAVAVNQFSVSRSYMRNYPDTPEGVRRPGEGPYGHTQIDFGGQWVMGRMVVLGHGKQLYHRQVQWGAVRAGFPVEDETPAQREDTLTREEYRRFARTADDIGHDADNLMYWFMGADPPEWRTVGGAVAAPLAGPAGDPFAAIAAVRAGDEAVTPALVEKLNVPAIGGPLYPPVHGIFYAPFGLLDSPKRAYRIFQGIALGFAFLAGLGLSALTRWRVWWSAATLVVLVFPGCGPALELGQNPTISLSIAVWGWVLASRGRDAAGGMVWGLFAFKPVWALAFFLVPLLMRRWRFLFAMVGTGVALGLATFPVVGIQSWFDWLHVGREAAALYNVHDSWINLSRDLQGLPRRFLHDLSLPEAERDTPLVKRVAWGLWAAVFAATVAIYLLRANRRPVGLGAAFLFWGAFLTCYRFMYYDLLLALMGFGALAAGPAGLLRTRVFPLRLSPAEPLRGGTPIPPERNGSDAVGYVNSFPLTVLFGLWLVANVLLQLDAQATLRSLAISREKPDGSVGPATLLLETNLNAPWDTGLILLVWFWAGVKLLVWGEPAEKTACPELPMGGVAPLK